MGARLNILLEYWQIISAAAFLIFGWGILFQKIKTLPTEKMVEKIINVKLEGHCINIMPLKELELKVNRLQKNMIENKHINDVENKLIALSLQEIRINLKNICFHLGIDYQNGNNNNK